MKKHKHTDIETDKHTVPPNVLAVANGNTPSSNVCSSHSKNMMWYGVLGTKELVQKTYKNLEQRVKLYLTAHTHTHAHTLTHTHSLSPSHSLSLPLPSPPLSAV